MNEKDQQIGYMLSRREALTLMGAAGAGLLVGGWPKKARAVPSTLRSPCIVRPEQTEGPYFVDERLHRSDIRTDPANGQVTPGALLALTFHVMRFYAGECRPVPDAQVDVWHCDAMGVYSDVRDPGFKTLGQKFLRGYQISDAEGSARFLTIYPGWYPIRTVHIHFKIRPAPVAGRSVEFTSQLYFPDELTDRIHANLPYSSKGRRRIRNQHDFIFHNGGNQLILEPSGTNDGYAVTFPIALQLS
ncbi:MAG TPA: intradiol ring-cleavage dioxygenase [Terriglobia bacterium]|nr:intradiol ring-cleavage dioxygenase [Terriglobia bacterium]